MTKTVYECKICGFKMDVSSKEYQVPTQCRRCECKNLRKIVKED